MLGYQLVYADPPWQYSDKSKHRGGAERHYPTMSVQELIGMRDYIKRYTASDSICLMWSTAPMLPVALRVMESWGYTYKTIAWVWVKRSDQGKLSWGMGHYTRSNAEICLLGIRNKGLKRYNRSTLNVQFAPRERHSKKPDMFYEIIEDLFGDVTRLELFARQSREGWHSHGNEIVIDPVRIGGGNEN